MNIMNMSDLQISLIIIGVVIIAGVAIFNWMQQLRYQRKVQAAFEHKHEDALLETNKSADQKERIEPQLNKANLSVLQAELEPVEISRINNGAKASADSNIAEYDSATNYVINIRSDSIIPATNLTALLQRKFDFGKPVYWLGQYQKGEPWEEVKMETNAKGNNFVSLKGCLQLADRSGPVSEVNLSKFRDMVQDFASQLKAVVDCPDITAAHDQAILLDKFCAEVDVMIGINIISKDDGAFVGTKIRALAEASGFKLEPEGLFKYRDDNNNVLFTLGNYEPTLFLPDNMKTLTTHGITFLLDVPRVANGEKVFDQMAHLAKIFSNTLSGIMVDDNRVPLSDNGIIRSKQQLSDIQTVMKNQNIYAGSHSALRLFV